MKQRRGRRLSYLACSEPLAQLGRVRIDPAVEAMNSSPGKRGYVFSRVERGVTAAQTGAKQYSTAMSIHPG